jgi:putative membrane protein
MAGTSPAMTIWIGHEHRRLVLSVPLIDEYAEDEARAHRAIRNRTAEGDASGRQEPQLGAAQNGVESARPAGNFPHGGFFHNAIIKARSSCPKCTKWRLHMTPANVSWWLVFVLALWQVGFLILEMFLWTTPWATHVSQLTEQTAKDTKAIGANMGLYNGFLAAGLFWSLYAPLPFRISLAVFFVGCVLIAGVYGGFRINRRIYLFQALPAVFALAALQVR